MDSQTLVYTNDNCVGCNKCISACSCMGACISGEVDENGLSRIEVDSTKCIACGACFDVCEHNARSYVDDTERFFTDLKNGEDISVIIAPAFKANYPDEYEGVLGGLKKLGVKHFLSVSFGADITTWGYINYIQKHNFLGGISQPCPAVVSYIEHYMPELLPKLFPVQSPMMCTAIYAKKVMKLPGKLAFISPCIAKKLEIDDPNNKGYVSYNVTFEHLMKYVRENNISGPDCSDEIEYGLGSIYPTPGGLKENVYWLLGESVFIRQIEGEKRMYHWLKANKDRIEKNKTPFLFIDALNCENGCICGTATNPEMSETDDALYNLHYIKEKVKKNDKKSAWSKRLTPEKRLAALNKQFKDLNL
ncbi:MAG: 4Fe-4S binding protein, partial [Lachnospiraceae bacterium]|nr:4Fe-4S binding protein [Lachnospiraceae bacterium]